MSWEIELAVTVTVSSDEEAERFQSAAYSGLAGEILRLGILYGQLPVQGSSGNRVSANKQAEQNIELKRVEDKVPTARPIAPVEPEPKKERKSGLGGRKRIGRV